MIRSRSCRFLMTAVIAIQGIYIGSGCDSPECGKKLLSGKTTQSAQYLHQFNEMNALSEERKHRDAEAILPFIGLTGSSRQSRSCCQNGGTCILGSFCACPKYYTGRSCEYDERVRSCGVIPHGEWVQKGCSYCRCGYGVLHCFPHIFHNNCDDSQEVLWFRSDGYRMQQPSHLMSLAVLLLVFI